MFACILNAMTIQSVISLRRTVFYRGAGPARAGRRSAAAARTGAASTQLPLGTLLLLLLLLLPLPPPNLRPPLAAPPSLPLPPLPRRARGRHVYCAAVFGRRVPGGGAHTHG